MLFDAAKNLYLCVLSIGYIIFIIFIIFNIFIIVEFKYAIWYRNIIEMHW